ncbi:Dihydrolipoyllysine-residue succinyltransferase component [Capsicum annuum]|nr:Dihydrolipoyllysine-residue succinyltransferase component [Capsicum annuum]
MVPNMQLTKDDTDPFDDPERYRRLVRKLNYLIVTHSNILLHKQNVVSRSNVESEYRLMAQFTYLIDQVYDAGRFKAQGRFLRLFCFGCLGKSIYAVRPAVSTSRNSSAVTQESYLFGNCCCLVPVAGGRRLVSCGISQILLLPRQCGHARHFSHLVLPDDLVDAVVPYMGESISDGTLAKLLKNPGDKVEVDEPIAQIETDKVTIDVTSPEAGVIQKFVAKEGDTVEPGYKVAIISKSSECVESVDHVAPSEKPSEKEAPKPPSPVQEKKEEDVKPKVEIAPVKKSKETSPPPKRSATEPQLPPKERERRVPMTRLRKRVATRLKDSQNTFALLTTFNEVDMTNLMKLRAEYKDAFVEKHGVKLGLMSGFVKGLVVPVLRDVDKMNFAEIEKTINELAKKATNGTISIDEMAGGSFTISNGGVYGSLLSTPIINPPQSAILGMHSIVNRPMVVGGNIVSRPMMYIALTYDHRLIDGREAVYFLRRIKDVVEDPHRLLLDV